MLEYAGIAIDSSLGQQRTLQCLAVWHDGFGFSVIYMVELSQSKFKVPVMVVIPW